MIFKSHLLIMLVFALITSVMLAFIRCNEAAAIKRYALKLFLYMSGSVVAISWLMRIL